MVCVMRPVNVRRYRHKASSSFPVIMLRRRLSVLKTVDRHHKHALCQLSVYKTCQNTSTGILECAALAQFLQGLDRVLSHCVKPPLFSVKPPFGTFTLPRPPTAVLTFSILIASCFGSLFPIASSVSSSRLPDHAPSLPEPAACFGGAWFSTRACCAAYAASPAGCSRRALQNSCSSASSLRCSSAGGCICVKT